jgi:FMN phosphatase YigB (HAD superfamily)
MKLTDFRVLTFDCYGTLIDWETGLSRALESLLSGALAKPSQQDLLAAFGRHEADQEAKTPEMPYSKRDAARAGLRRAARAG